MAKPMLVWLSISERINKYEFQKAFRSSLQQPWFKPSENIYPLYIALVIGLTRERYVVIGLPSWTHLRTRYWGVFTLLGLKDLLRGFGLWYCESWGIGENEKVKHDSTTQSFFCRCCWNRPGVILFSVVRKITASRENRGEPLGDQVVKTADSQATSAG